MDVKYPPHLDHTSTEFIKIKEDLLKILNSTCKDTTISIDPDDDSKLNVTFTLDFDEIYFYLQADGTFISWICDNKSGKASTPLYSLSNFRITRHGFQNYNHINALLNFVLTEDNKLRDIFNKYMLDGVKEFRTDNTKTLGMEVTTLKYGTLTTHGRWN